MNTSQTHQSHPTQLSDSTLLDVLAILSRGKWLFIWVFTLAMAIAGLAIYVVGPRYEASASVLVNTKAAQTQVTDLLDKVFSGAISNTLQNELEVLKSRALAEIVVRDLMTTKYLDSGKQSPILIIRPDGEDESLNQSILMDHILKRLDHSVSFEVVPKTDVIRIAARSKDPREAALLANAFAQAYQNKNMADSRAKSRSIREYLQMQVKEKQHSLAAMEDSLKRYMEQKGVVSLDEEAKKLIEQLSALKAQKDAVDIQISTIERTFVSYQEQLSTQEKDFAAVIGESNDPYIRLVQEQLAKLEVQRDVLATQNPDIATQEIYTTKVKEIDAQIAALRGKLKSRTDQFMKTIVPSSQEGSSRSGPADYLMRIKQKILEAQIELQALHAKRKALDEPLQQCEALFERLPAKSMQFARLQRDKASVEKLFLVLEEKYNQASLMEQSEFGSVGIIDAAVAPAEPSDARTLFILMLGSLFGFGAGLAAVFIHDYLDPRIHLPQDLRRRGYALLATVGRTDKELKRFGKGKTVSLNRRAINTHVITLTNPHSVNSEAYRYLRTTLRRGEGPRPPRVIMVTSSKLGEGKSTTVANLAVAFAQERKKVLLVDADLRRPVLHSMFDNSQAPGLSDFLMGDSRDEISIQLTGLQQLHMLASGKLPYNPSELLGSEAMRLFIAQVRETYDYVFFDSSPVLAVTDPCVLASQMDKVILVVKAGETGVRELERSMEILHENSEDTPAIVLNLLNPRWSRGFISRRSGYGQYGYTYQPSPGQANSRSFAAMG